MSLKLPHRSAVARSSSKDLGARRRGYREALEIDPRARADAARARRAGARQGRAGAGGAVLEPIYESAGEWDKLDRRPRGDGRRTTKIRSRGSSCSTASPSSTSACRHANAAFDAYGRALRDDSSNEDGSVTSSGSPRDRHWAGWRRSTRAELGSRSTSPRQVDLLLRARARVRGGARAARRGDRDLPPRHRRRVRQQAALLALDRLYSAPSVGRAGRDPAQRDPARAERRGRSSRCSSASARSTSRRSATCRRRVEVYREILTADPTHDRRAPRSSSCSLDGTMQIEIAAVLEPLYRSGRGVGEAAQDLRGAARQAHRRGRAAALLRRARARSPSTSSSISRGVRLVGRGAREDPKSEHALDEMQRLARATHQWDDLRRHDGRAPRAPEQTPDGPARRAAAAGRSFENELRDLRTRREAHLQVLRRAREGCRRARRARSDLRSRGCTRTSPTILRRRIDVTDDSDELIELYFRLGRVYAEALGDSTARSQLHRGARAGRRNRARARGARAALLPQRALAGAVRHLREDGRRRPGRRAAWPTATRAWRRSPPTRSTTRARRSSCGAASSTSAARMPSRSRAWPICTRRPSSGASSSRSSSGRSRRRPSPTSRSRSTSASAASGARSCSASATRSRLAEGPGDRPAPTSTRCARWPRSTSSAGAGKSWSRRCTG